MCSKRAGPTTSVNDIPVFSLYGEATAVDDAEFVHIEEIRARSERYDWRIKPHRHHGLFQILFIRDGGAEVEADGGVRTAEGPCAITIPPGVVHSFRFRPGTAGHVLTIAEAMLAAHNRGFVEALFVEPAVIALCAAGETARRIEALLDHIQAESRDHAAGRALMNEWLVGAILLLLARQRASAAQAVGRPERERFNRFRALVERHFLAHWSVAQYAQAMHMTEGRLNRLTRVFTGKSAFDLIQNRLLLEARRKLIYVAAPVSLIAYELGFNDPAYFSRFFRNRTGFTPSEFRRRAREWTERRP